MIRATCQISNDTRYTIRDIRIAIHDTRFANQGFDLNHQTSYYEWTINMLNEHLQMISNNRNILNKHVDFFKERIFDSEEHKKRLDWIDTNMATKDDFKKIMEKLEYLVYLCEKRDQEMAKTLKILFK